MELGVEWQSALLPRGVQRLIRVLRSTQQHALRSCRPICWNGAVLASYLSSQLVLSRCSSDWVGQGWTVEW